MSNDKTVAQASIFDPTLLQSIPNEVIEAERTISAFFNRNSDTHWELGGIQKRGATPIVATVPSEPTCRDDGRCQYAIDHGAEGLGHCPKGKCQMPEEVYSPSEPVAWMVYWGIGKMKPLHPACSTLEQAEQVAATIKSATEIRPLYAAPSTAAEQASNERNALIDQCITLILDLPGLEGIEAIRALKSTTPADKGNAPAEVKS